MTCLPFTSFHCAGCDLSKTITYVKKEGCWKKNTLSRGIQSLFLVLVLGLTKGFSSVTHPPSNGWTRHLSSVKGSYATTRNIYTSPLLGSYITVGHGQGTYFAFILLPLPLVGKIFIVPFALICMMHSFSLSTTSWTLWFSCITSIGALQRNDIVSNWYQNSIFLIKEPSRLCENISHQHFLKSNLHFQCSVVLFV